MMLIPKSFFSDFEGNEESKSRNASRNSKKVSFSTDIKQSIIDNLELRDDRLNPEELYVELDKITGDPLTGCIKR